MLLLEMSERIEICLHSNLTFSLVCHVYGGLVIEVERRALRAVVL